MENGKNLNVNGLKKGSSIDLILRGAYYCLGSTLCTHGTQENGKILNVNGERLNVKTILYTANLIASVKLALGEKYGREN